VSVRYLGRIVGLELLRVVSELVLGVALVLLLVLRGGWAVTSACAVLRRS
jgi:hypothetical protein